MVWEREYRGMGKVLSLCVILLLGSLIITGCGGQSASTEASSSAGMTNSELQARVRTQLDTDPAIKAAQLLVDTDSGKHELTLSGTVKSQELRDKAARLAQDSAPGITVKNNIVVRPPEVARSEDPAGRTPVPAKQRKRAKR